MMQLFDLTILSRYLTYLDLSPHTEYFSKASSGAFKSNSLVSSGNRAYFHESLLPTLTAIQDYFGHLPHTIFVKNENETARQLLLSNGYQQSGSFPLMLAEIKNMKCKSTPPEIEVREIPKDILNLNAWLDISAKAYNANKEEYQKFLQYLASTPLWPDIKFFIAYYQNIPAASCIVILRGNIGALHRVGTLPEFRGKGLGSAISSIPFQILQNHDLEYAILLASDMGKPVYEKIGFRTIACLDAFKPQQNA